MSKEVTYILVPNRGHLTLKVGGISLEHAKRVCADWGSSQNVNCGKPLQRCVVKLPASADSNSDDDHSIWLYRIYHNSVVDGPGRRSVVQVAGCSIRCLGCYVPETHDRNNGNLVYISSILSEILSRRTEHDGVTILGGEPFDQPGAVAELVLRLKRFNMHISMYTGKTLEDLIERADPCVDYILAHIDLLIDGPFEQSLVSGTGEYRGSSNQSIYRQGTIMNGLACND